MKKKQLYMIAGIILIGLFLIQNNFLTLIDVPGYTRMNFNSGGVIYEGKSSSLTYNGQTYTAEVATVPDGAGYAAVRFKENGVQIGGTLNSPAPDCPSCSDYYPSVETLKTGIKGSILCYTNRNSADPNQPLMGTFCYVAIYFSTTTTPTTCNYNGVVYQDGEQRKIVNGCIENFNHKQCADNYQFTTCSNGVWYGMSICYPSDTCQTSPGPGPTPGCVNDETKTCITSAGCNGVITCSNGEWGACIKNDNNCDNWMIPQWVYFLAIGAGIVLILYGVMKK